MFLRFFLIVIPVVLGLLLGTQNVDANGSQTKPKEVHDGSPSPPKLNNPRADNKPTSYDQRGTEENPLVIKGIPAKKTDEEAQEDRGEREVKLAIDRDVAKYTGLQVLVACIMAGIAICQVFLFWGQLHLMRDTLNVSKSSADAALEQAQAIKLSERAYINVSPFPPGLILGENENQGRYLVHLKVTCFGGTPATITNSVVDCICLPRHGELPTEPDYSQAIHTRGTCFVVPEDFVQTKAERRFNGSANTSVAEAVKVGETRFVILGYVDYIDCFGQRHRCGYAREYDHQLDDPNRYSTVKYRKRNNLVFVPEMDYNFDRLRKQGEGNDWDEPT